MKLIVSRIYLNYVLFIAVYTNLYKCRSAIFTTYPTTNTTWKFGEKVLISWTVRNKPDSDTSGKLNINNNSTTNDNSTKNNSIRKTTANINKRSNNTFIENNSSGTNSTTKSKESVILNLMKSFNNVQRIIGFIAEIQDINTQSELTWIVSTVPETSAEYYLRFTHKDDNFDWSANFTVNSPQP